MAIALRHNSRYDRDGFKWWIVRNGRDDYDFNGQPFIGGEQPLSNDELRQAHELARAQHIEPDAMWFGSEAEKMLQDESDESWDEFMAGLDPELDWDIQQQRVYPGAL